MGVRREVERTANGMRLGGASTEPHSWECGELSSSPPLAATVSSFNGAALVGVRRADVDQKVPGLMNGFNGAALVGVRRVIGHADQLHRLFRASTEPHSWECGELAESMMEFLQLLELQRSRTRGSAESHRMRRTVTTAMKCFNGAALVGVRRGPAGGVNG